MSEPLITICMITYNHINFIRDAIEGVLIQKTNFPFELIIADDYSTDGTRDIILSYREKYPDIITLILQEKNVGVAQNWVDMVSAPKSKYIAFCDGDDYWTDPCKLQKQVEFLENNPDYAICYHPAEYIYESAAPKRIFNVTYDENETTYTEDLIKNDYITFCSCVLRRDNIKEIPSWFKDLKALDWPLLLLASFGKKIFRLKDTMSVYRIHDESIWSSKKYSYLLVNSLNLLGYLEKATPPIYLQHFKNKKFDTIIELYKTYLIENKIIEAFKLIPRIYSIKNQQNMKTNFMAAKIIVVSFIRKFIKKRRIK